MFNKFKEVQFSKHRTGIFSDAIFAIIITLLVLEIKVPPIKNHEDTIELYCAFINMLPIIISWVISFQWLAVIWVQHHNLFHMAKQIDYGIVYINIILLFFVCFLPFPAALLGEYPQNRLAVLMFGCVTTLASLCHVWLYYYLAKNHLKDTYNKVSVMKNVRKAFIMAPLLLIVASAVSFINIYLPFVIYFVVPFLFLLPLDKEAAVIEHPE